MTFPKKWRKPSLRLLLRECCQTSRTTKRKKCFVYLRNLKFDWIYCQSYLKYTKSWWYLISNIFGGYISNSISLISTEDRLDIFRLKFTNFGLISNYFLFFYFLCPNDSILRWGRWQFNLSLNFFLISKVNQFHISKSNHLTKTIQKSRT